MIDGLHAFLFPFGPELRIIHSQQLIAGVLEGSGKSGGQGGEIADDRGAVAASAVYHILADNHAQTVAVVIPSGAFHLNMLAQHVKAKIFHDSNVIKKRILGRGGVKAVRPVALIQHPHEKVRLVV